MIRPRNSPRRLDWSRWIELVRRLAGSDYAHLAEHYSFRTAWHGGFNPQQALDDARGMA